MLNPQFFFLDLFAVLALLISFWGLGSQKRWGFTLNIIGSILMIVFGVLSNSWPIIVGNTIFSVLGIRGFIKWKPSPPPTPNSWVSTCINCHPEDIE